jgi:hypothetical protein
LTNGAFAPPTVPYKRYRIKAHAAAFAGEWKDAHYERGETHTFLQRVFQLFGVIRRRVASFEHGVNLPERLVEQKSAGRSLTPARWQALDYFPGLKEHELPPPNQARPEKVKGRRPLRARV